MTERLANNFDGLRLLGSLMVLFSHQLALSGHAEPRVFGVKLGTLGVMMFFTISGYLVTASWESDPHLIRFLRRRLLRIWPALALSLTVCISFVCMVMIPPSDRAIVPNLLLSYLPNYAFVWKDGIFFENNPYKFLNGALWTIPLEVQCYGAVVIFGLVVRQQMRNALIVLAAIITVLQLSTNWSITSRTLPQFFQPSEDFNLPTFFLAGALMYLVPVLRSHKGTCALALLGLIAGLAGQTGIAWSVLVPILVLNVGLTSWPIFRSAACFGDLSYGIYLWAWPIQQLGVSIFGIQTYWPALLILTMVSTVSMAFLSWHLVEKHCLRLKPSVRLSSV
jgi:peptidoglycan/LPS O-acetylase OafA/YrhL